MPPPCTLRCCPVGLRATGKSPCQPQAAKGRPGVSGPGFPEMCHLWGAQGDSHVEVISCRVLGTPVCPSGLLSKARQGHLPQSHCVKREAVGWGLPHGKPAGLAGLARMLSSQALEAGRPSNPSPPSPAVWPGQVTEAPKGMLCQGRPSPPGGHRLSPGASQTTASRLQAAPRRLAPSRATPVLSPARSQPRPNA